jgi:hypothetical protein
MGCRDPWVLRHLRELALKRKVVVVSVAVLALQCGGQTPSTLADGGSPVDEASDGSSGEASPECPRVATSCPEGCYPRLARQLDAARDCTFVVTVGCRTWNGSTADAMCLRNDTDGALITGPRSELGGLPGWSPCTVGEERAVGRPLCQ